MHLRNGQAGASGHGAERGAYTVLKPSKKLTPFLGSGFSAQQADLLLGDEVDGGYEYQQANRHLDHAVISTPARPGRITSLRTSARRTRIYPATATATDTTMSNQPVMG